MQRPSAPQQLVPGAGTLAYVQASDGLTYAEGRSHIGITRVHDS